MTAIRFIPASITSGSVVKSARNCRPKASSPPPNTSPTPKL